MKRYELEEASYPAPGYCLEEDPDGGYVAYEDHNAEIDKYKKLINEIETACDYTNSADNIKSLINKHKGE